MIIVVPPHEEPGALRPSELSLTQVTVSPGGEFAMEADDPRNTRRAGAQRVHGMRGYLTVMVPFMPAAAWPGTEQR